MKVYSYVRFSDIKQAAGASSDRQAAYARQWAADHGMVLDESLTMRDEGLSAYHQKHVKNGALGVFLAAITEGKIPAGSVLIVEGLDRLSRAEPILAQAQLAQIINADITVVTAGDGKQYNRESLKANPMDLVFSLLVMIRANEESETKSKRVSDAIQRKCVAWAEGTYRGRVPGGKDPAWVRWVDGKVEHIPEVAAAVRLAIQLYVEGYGPFRILQVMSERKMVVTGGKRAANISALITKQPILFIGERPMSVNGVDYVLTGYYPPLLSADEYARLLACIATRKQKPRASGGKSLFPSLFTGLGVAVCGHCGDYIVSQNHVRTTQTGKSLYRRFRCPACELASSKRRNVVHLASCPTEPIERAILDYCSDQFNLTALMSGGDQTTALRAEHAASTLLIDDLTRKVGKLLDAALDDPDGLPQAVIRRMKEMETQISAEKIRERELSAAITVATTDNPVSATAWENLRKDVIAMDYDARLKCRQLVGDTFSTIKIFFRGALPGTPPEVLDLLLVSKAGVSRWLRIVRKTGELIAGRERAI